MSKIKWKNYRSRYSIKDYINSKNYINDYLIMYNNYQKYMI